MALPFIKWVGGKRQLLESIIPEFPESYGTYREGFAGGAAVFFKLCPTQSVINDWNPDLVACYRVIKSDPQTLMARLDELSGIEEVARKEKFLQLRKEAPTSDMDRAVRLIFLNKNCFNGLYRVNKKGQFNTPFGKYKKPPKLYSAENLLACSAALQNTTILNGDFEAACVDAKPGDLVYFDPPYVPVSVTSDFASYTSEGFGKKDQERLARVFAELYDRGVSVVLSNSDTEFVRSLYARFEIRTVMAARSINSKGSKRGAVKETLVVAVHR